MTAGESDKFFNMRSARNHRASEKLSIPLPEITFGNNLVSLRRKKGKERAFDDTDFESNCIIFDGLHAISKVDATGDQNIKVAYADTWAKSRKLDGTAQGGSVIETVKNYDWTYSTNYTGTTSGNIVRLL